MELKLIVGGLVSAAPGLIIWILAVIFSSVLLRKGGGRPERLLIIGSSIMLVKSILSIFVPLIHDLLTQSELRRVEAAGWISGVNVFLGLISLAGIVCLFYAFWKKFNTNIRVTTDN